MSKLIMAVLFSATSLVGVTATASSAQAQVYVDSGTDLFVGDSVRVYGNGTWYPAVVLDLSGRSALVRYGGSWVTDWVDLSRVSYGNVNVVYRPIISANWHSPYRWHSYYRDHHPAYRTNYAPVRYDNGWHGGGHRNNDRGHGNDRGHHNNGRGNRNHR